MSPGHVVALWRYPVKSMLGEQCDAVEIDNRGVVGDRVFAVRDPEGKLGSGKNTRRFRSIDGLFGFRARGEGDVEIAFPDGRRMKAGDPAIHEALSAALQTVPPDRAGAVARHEADDQRTENGYDQHEPSQVMSRG